MDVIAIKEKGAINPIEVDKVSNLNLGFKTLNPLQSKLAIEGLYKKDCNLIIGWQTSTGKTVVAELVCEAVMEQGKKFVYACPLKSLAEEKIRRFKQIFPDKNIEISSGDHKDFERRKIKAQKADIAIVTTELLDSISRNKNLLRYLIGETQAIVVDEAHILATERGAAVEGSLIRISRYNAEIRLILLSATVPNIKEIGEWVHSLNWKKTYIMQSDWRPVKIEWHIKKIKPANPYGFWRERTVRKIREKIFSILEEDPNAQILLFVWTKKDGRKIQDFLNQAGIPTLFHNASLEFNERLDYEEKFENRKIKVLISTTTLAWGRNTCARHVIIMGDKRGIEKVPGWDVIQMGGRAGRTGLAPKGDVWWYVSKKDYAEKILKFPPTIISSLKDKRNLAFQILGEIPWEGITLQEIVEWFSCTLANRQLTDNEKRSLLNNALDILINKTGCATLIDKKIIKPTRLGIIAKRFYLDPYTAFSWNLILERIILLRLTKEITDPYLSFLIFLAHSEFKKGFFLSREEENELELLVDEKLLKFASLKLFLGSSHLYLTWKGVEWYFQQVLNPEKKVWPHYKLREFLYDLDRISAACVCIAREILGEEKLGDQLQRMGTILQYGAPLEAYSLLQIHGIGTKRASRLLKIGIKDEETLRKEIARNNQKVFKILPSSVIQNFLN